MPSLKGHLKKASFTIGMVINQQDNRNKIILADVSEIRGHVAQPFTHQGMKRKDIVPFTRSNSKVIIEQILVLISVLSRMGHFICSVVLGILLAMDYGEDKLASSCLQGASNYLQPQS